MVIDTQKKVFRIHLRRMIIFFAFAILVLLVILIGKLPKTYLGLNKYHWAIVISVIYILSMIFEAMLEKRYIFFAIEKNKLMLRYFSLGYFNMRKNSIEIPLEEFSRYEFRKTFGGLKKSITLYRQVKDKEAKYPEVSLSLLNDEEIHILRSALDRYSKE